jgi:biotin transport system substrate-specific component
MSQALPGPALGRPFARSLATTVARETTVVLGVAVALAAASRVAFPLGFTPVPITAQTFIVLLAGVLVGARRAGSGALAYLALGVAGVPWFAAGGATLGYLVGFALAAIVVGRAADAGRLDRRAGALGVMAGAHALIHLLGATWLGVFLGVGPGVAFALGVAPFLIGDALKVVAAAVLAPSLVRLRG